MQAVQDVTFVVHVMRAKCCTCSPELELRKSSNKGPELLVAFAWQRWAFHLWIYLRCQETQKKIEAVNSHGVCNYVEALHEIYSDAIQGDQYEQREPSRPNMRNALVNPISVGPTELSESVVVCQGVRWLFLSP